MSRSGYGSATVNSFTLEDLCSSDPSRLYSPQNSNEAPQHHHHHHNSKGSGEHCLDHSLNRSVESSLRHSNFSQSTLGEMEHAIRKLSIEEAQVLLANMSGSDPRDLLSRMMKGENFVPELRTRLKLECPLHCPWNERFQKLLDLPDTPSKFAALSNLGNDFVHAATVYARVLIDELFLPWESKMIKPCDLGGIHGGVKYLCHGILFKVALAAAPDDLFSGLDANAAKAAGHELKSLVTIFNACQDDGKLKDLRVPLMCLIDYRGFRVVAISVLPISRDTLRYGSSDGGKTVHDDDVRFTVAMKRLGNKLGLKRHVVGNQSLHSPGDIEGHSGLDGRLYLIDLARLFPPEFPDTPVGKNDIWFKLLRGEAVMAWGKPLSSDALSRWGKVGGRQNDWEVKQASEWLHHVLVPKCALQLDEMVMGVVIASDTIRVKDLLHQMGVNCRHLGKVRHWCNQDLSRQLLATEILARTIKCHANLSLREKMREMRLPVDQPYRHLVVNLLNRVLGNRGGDSEAFWRKELRDMVMGKFGPETFNDDEMEEGFDLRRTIVSVVDLIRRLLQFLGVSLTKKAQSELVRAFEDVPLAGTFRFVDSDIMSISPRVKHATFIDKATGVMLQNHGEVLYAHGDHANEALRMFEVADMSFKRAIASCATSSQVYLHWAEVSKKLAHMWVERAASAAAAVSVEASVPVSGHLGSSAHKDGSSSGAVDKKHALEYAQKLARHYFDQLTDAVSQALRLQPSLADTFWSWAGDVKVKAETTTHTTRRPLLLYGALHLYLALFENHKALVESHNFLYEHGDVCRSSAMERTGSRFGQRQLIDMAAKAWEQVFAVDLDRRMSVWEMVNHELPSLGDRTYLASLIMMSEYSPEVLFEDVLQVFYQRDLIDLSGVRDLTESSLVDLFSNEQFAVTRVRLNGCVELTSRFLVFVATETPFLTEICLSGTKVDDSAVRVMCKKCLHLELVDLSMCANVHDGCCRFLATLPNLKQLFVRGCDLSDRPLREVVACNEHFVSLALLDISLANRITYTACHELQSRKPRVRIIHTAKPLFLSTEKLPSSVSITDSGCVCTWGNLTSAHMVRANAVIPSEMDLFYFEVEILEPGHDSSIGIGLAPRGHSLGGMPGWYSGSYGYHCDDGQKFEGDEIGMGREWGPCCTRGDVVGCALDLKQRLMFFTKNGKMIGVAFENVAQDQYYPVVGSFSDGSKVRVCFEPSNWMFDLELERRLCHNDWKTVMPMPPFRVAKVQEGRAGGGLHVGDTDDDDGDNDDDDDVEQTIINHLKKK